MLLKYRGGEGESCSVINDADRVVSRIRTGEVPYKAVNTPVFLGGRYLRDGATSQNKHIISQGPFLLTYYKCKGSDGFGGVGTTKCQLAVLDGRNSRGVGGFNGS
jgi:hypothetical protein